MWDCFWGKLVTFSSGFDLHRELMIGLVFCTLFRININTSEQVWLVTSPWNVTVGIATKPELDTTASDNKT